MFIFSVPNPPSVNITSTGVPVAGDTYALTCNVSLSESLRQSPIIEWTDPSGLGLNDNSLIDVTLSSSSQSTTITLSFTQLHTSHGGNYVCRAVIIDTDADIFIINNITLNLVVEGKYYILYSRL